MSWSNVLMLSATIPSFDDDKEEDSPKMEKIDEEDIESFFNFKK